MSTQLEYTTPDTVSSILLAAWQIDTSKPERALRHLVNPTPPKDYGYLDAIATLCSLVPQCESASAAIQIGVESNHLYIATIPPAPLTLRQAMTTWIHLMQQIPAFTPKSLKPHVDPKLEGSMAAIPPGPIRNFIASVYRICSQKLLDSIRHYRAEELLDEVSGAPDEEVEFWGLKVDERPSLVEGLQIMTEVTERDLSAWSVDEIVRLHWAAKTIAMFTAKFPEAKYLATAGRLSQAIDFIITSATTQNGQKTLRLHHDVHWVNAASSREFIATTNTREFMGSLTDDEELCLKVPDDLATPPKAMSKVEGSSNHYKGTGVIHCESALLHYVFDHDLSIHPYIGSSQPTCYACLMLVRAFNQAFNKKFSLGRRCGTIDTTWLCPEMGTQLYDKLVSSLRQDFKVFCEKARSDRASYRSLGII